MTHALVDVGGYRLDIRTVGTGTPAVVCVPAIGGAHDRWLDTAAMIAETTTTITYGRPGLGDSDQLPPGEEAIPRDGRWIAEQLRTLLRNADVPPPYVLTSGSVGGWVVDQFAATWPEEVAGLVLNDPTGTRDFVGLDNPIRAHHTAAGDLPDADEGGILFSVQMRRAFRTVAAPVNRDGRFVVLSSAVGRWLRNEPGEWHQPLTLGEIDLQWQQMQREWAQRLDAVHVIADTAGHHIYHEQPALTAAVVQAVVHAVREQRPVAFKDDQLAMIEATLATPPTPEARR